MAALVVSLSYLPHAFLLHRHHDPAPPVEKALELGGTCTAEHGVGLRKRKFLPKEHGPALEWMRRLKALFDPEGLLNPGKVV